MLATLASNDNGHQTMIAQWNRQAIKGMAVTFSGQPLVEAMVSLVDVEKPHSKSGQLGRTGFFHMAMMRCSKVPNFVAITHRFGRTFCTIKPLVQNHAGNIEPQTQLL